MNCEVGCSPYCTTCGRRKNPVGRSAPLEMANSLCDFECPGYREEPTACRLWPGECAACFMSGTCPKHAEVNE